MSSAAIAAALRAIADANAGALRPEDVVAAARDPASPLHQHFTWELGQAAAERWLDQARALIRTVRVRVTTTTFELHVPAYIRDPAQPTKSQGYIAIGKLATDEDLARQAVVAEFARASAALERARNVAAVLGMEAEVQRIYAEVIELSERTQTAGSA